VGGKEFLVECDLDYKSLIVIDEDCLAEGFEIDQYANIISINGENVTGTWTDGEWTEFEAYVGAPKTRPLA
jgi:hypothetical protein